MVAHTRGAALAQAHRLSNTVRKGQFKLAHRPGDKDKERRAEVCDWMK